MSSPLVVPNPEPRPTAVQRNPAVIVSQPLEIHRPAHAPDIFVDEVAVDLADLLVVDFLEDLRDGGL